MSAPDPSRLDANQVLQGSFDEARGRLRVDAQSTVVNADIDVNISALEDSVAIADPDGDFLAVNDNGSINIESVQLEFNNDLYQRVLPVLTNANFLKTANYDSIVQTYSGNTAVLSYREDTFEIATVEIRFASAHDWDLSIKRYLLNDNGTKLLDDDGTALLLE